GAKVLAHRGDLAMLEEGRNGPMRSTSFLGELGRGISDKPFPPLRPDILIDGRFDLTPFGVNGAVVPVPGHTPGSVAVVLATGDAIVGDLLRGGLWNATDPERHFFHDDCRAAEAQVRRLVDAGASRLFVGHGGPINAFAAVAYVRATPCP